MHNMGLKFFWDFEVGPELEKVVYEIKWCENVGHRQSASVFCLKA